MPVHVVSLTDLVEHTVPGGIDYEEDGSYRWLCVDASDDDPSGLGAERDRCACGPTWEHVPRIGGPDGWVVVHASLDGRELREKA